MRVFQACEVLRLRAPDIDVRATSTDDVQDSTVVLSKTALGKCRGREAD